MICTVKELGQCMQDLFPRAAIYEFENLRRVDVGCPELIIYICADNVQVYWRDMGLQKHEMLSSLFDLQDWVISHCDEYHR
ncbi:hypothetical protein RsoM2USA_291 [Ralstonia phage RsoM2USA]|nr:hypothetical protein RsoM2USA_291 [Ralstonia phage RsoM2USA]